MSEGTKKDEKGVTGSVARSIGGVGTFIDTHHEGGVTRRVEKDFDNREEKGWKREKPKEESKVNNEDFLNRG